VEAFSLVSAPPKEVWLR